MLWFCPSVWPLKQKNTFIGRPQLFWPQSSSTLSQLLNTIQNRPISRQYTAHSVTQPHYRRTCRDSSRTIEAFKLSFSTILGPVRMQHAAHRKVDKVHPEDDESFSSVAFNQKATSRCQPFIRLWSTESSDSATADSEDRSIKDRRWTDRSNTNTRFHLSNCRSFTQTISRRRTLRDRRRRHSKPSPPLSCSPFHSVPLPTRSFTFSLSSGLLLISLPSRSPIISATSHFHQQILFSRSPSNRILLYPRYTISCLGPSIKYVTLFWTIFNPLPLSHFVIHLGTPLKYVTLWKPPKLTKSWRLPSFSLRFWTL